jgi:hypothetical protein
MNVNSAISSHEHFKNATLLSITQIHTGAQPNKLKLLKPYK